MFEYFSKHQINSLLCNEDKHKEINEFAIIGKLEDLLAQVLFLLHFIADVRLLTLTPACKQ